MAMINVNSDSQDGFYRYKMPKLMAKVEGKGNGIKTVITNMKEIATALGRPPMYPTKYFGCELGAQTQYDPKNERYIVNGAHESDRLQTLLFCFIKKFVLCSSCDNPETELHVREKKGVTAHCKACGNTFPIDPVHRLTQYILKNPSDAEGLASASSAVKGKGGKKGKRVGAANDSPQDNDPATNNETGMVAENDALVDHVDRNGDDSDDDWAGDISKEAQDRRMAEISMAVRALAINDDLNKSDAERADIFYAFVKKIYAEDKEQIKQSKQVGHIRAEADRLELGDMAVMILVEVLWHSPEGIVELIKHSATCLRKFSDKNTKSQMYIVGAAEKTIDRWQASLLPKAVHMFKALYDLDIVDESVFLQWAGKGPSKKYVPRALSVKIHELMKPFIKWLQEAEEESSEDDMEEDVESSEGSTNDGKDVSPTPDKPPQVNGQQQEGDDIDIDAI